MAIRVAVSEGRGKAFEAQHQKDIVKLFQSGLGPATPSTDNTTLPHVLQTKATGTVFVPVSGDGPGVPLQKAKTS